LAKRERCQRTAIRESGPTRRVHIDSPCECEHNNSDSLDARLFFTVVLAVAPAVTMDEASSLSWYLDREDASSMVLAVAPAVTMDEASSLSCACECVRVCVNPARRPNPCGGT